MVTHLRRGETNVPLLLAVRDHTVVPEVELDTVESASVRESIAQIRFALSQLSARNGHHEFEEMARFLARETVSRNILPATGPVSAGGDQGRDFETFKTYVVGQVLATGSQIGIAEGENVAFACTLQAEDLGSKVLSDVKKIVGQGSPVEHIVYYAEANLAVGLRHTLQGRAKDDFGVHLEVFDGAAIAELLCQRHLYWIAQEFLHLPASALPPIPDRPDWYETDLRRWRENDYVPTTPGDLVDLSGCLRYATYHEHAAVDLPFWIDRISALIRDEVPCSTKQRARYEMVVAHLVGLGDLRPMDALVATYMANALEAEDPSQLSDASVLLLYCVGARGRGLTSHSEGQVLDWNDQLQRRVAELLDATEQPGRRCSLLETLGWLRSQPDLVAALERGIDYRLDPEIPRLSLEEIEAIAQRGLIEPVHIPVVDLQGAFDAWTEMVDLLPQARLFPVERLAQMMRITAPILIEDRRYDAVVTALDERIAEIAGGDAAASSARDRAMMFYRHSRLLDALREIHRARMGWFSGETTEGLVLATLMMSQIYRELELPLAAKFSAMTAARLVGDDNRELYARACFKAAEADYHQAAWFSSILIADLGLRAHLLLAEDPHDWERHPHLQDVFFEFAIVRAFAAAAGGTYEEFVLDVLGRTGANELLDDLLQGLGAPPWWEDLSANEFTERVAEELGQPAFSDGGDRRSHSWRALGVTWALEFPNDYDSTMVGERLAAFAQITLAEMAAHDPALLPTRVVFEVETIPESEEVISEHESDGHGSRWRIHLPASGPTSSDLVRRVGQETLSVVIEAIADVSVLPQDEFSDLLEALFEDGLLDKLSFGTVYDVAYRDLISRERFEEAPRQASPPVQTDLQPVPRQTDDLRPPGCGPHYDLEESTALVVDRYANVTETLVATLPALRSYLPFADVVRSLRTRGWKDWHILLAVLHVAQNHRLSLQRPPRNEAEANRLFEMFMRAEQPDDPAPMDMFTEDALREAIRFSWPSTLKVWGLQLRQNPPDIDALESLLAERYGYWTDDAPHDEPFVES